MSKKEEGIIIEIMTERHYDNEHVLVSAIVVVVFIVVVVVEKLLYV